MTRSDPGSHVAEVQVRWSECDPAGGVYYPNYFTLFESALFDFMEHRGATWPTLMRELEVVFPRVEAHARYRGPAAAGDRLRIEVRVAERRSRGLRIAFTITHLDGRSVAEGEVAFVAVSSTRAAEGAVDLPPRVVDLFRPISPHDGETG